YLQNEKPCAEDILIKQEAAARMMELLKMEKNLHKTIVLFRIEGYSFCEIGQKCSISESSARVIDFRVRKKLKEILTKEGFANV
ncbi:MAG: hypothetical protein RR728_04590, partial [Oscillospiraceae bacterium]